MPVFIVGTYDENGVPDAMNAAWGGIADDTRVVLCLSPEHKTVANLQKSGAFTLSMGDVAHMAECDYVGIVTANKEPDKVAKCGLHPVNCTVISYNPETCCLIGEIVNVNADESVLDEKGAIDQTKLEPISYDPVKHLYVRLGETVGRAFHDGRKFK